MGVSEITDRITDNSGGGVRLTRRAFVAGAAGAVGGVSAAVLAQATRPAVEGPVRLAQIGVQGGHYYHIVRGLRALPDCALVAVARAYPDEDLKPIMRSTAWSRDVKVFDDYRQMLDEVRPTIVSVFAPFAHNGRVSIEAVRRGCHVISEKPLAGSLDDLKRLKAERDKAGVRVTAVLPMRLAPALQAARKAVVEGAIGEPVLISAQKSYQWDGTRNWIYKSEKDYGGTIPWVVIHAVDYIRFVTGLEFAEVTARQAVKVHRDYPACADCGGLLFVMNNGGQATITFDYLRPAKAPSHGDDRLRVAGSEGIVEIRLTDKSWCELATNKDEPRPLVLPKDTPNLFVDFVESLRGLHPHYLPPDDPFIDTEVCLKARDAAEQGTTIKL